MIEEIVMHEIPVALVVVMIKSDILIHIEGHDVLEGNLTCFVHLDELLVDSQWR